MNEAAWRHVAHAVLPTVIAFFVVAGSYWRRSTSDAASQPRGKDAMERSSWVPRSARVVHLLAALASGSAILSGCNQRSRSQLAFTAVSAGTAHTCGITVAGAAFCWGMSTDGQLGHFGPGGGNAPGPGVCVSFGAPFPCSTVPVLVTGGLDFTTVSAGGHHACGVTSAGAAYCWGANSHGQLGDGTTSDRWSPVPVAGGVRFTALSAGNHHTCGVNSVGTVYCWGGNYLGQLGDGTTADRPSPVRVAGGSRRLPPGTLTPAG